MQIFERKSTKKVLVGCQINLVHQKIPYIARLRHLEDHIEAVDLYLMNWYLNRLNIEWISVINLLVITGMIHLSGELSHVIKNGSITATLMPRNSGLIPINLPKPLLKNLFDPKVMLCLVEFLKHDLLGVCSKWACSRYRSLFSTTGMSSWNFEMMVWTLLMLNPASVATAFTVTRQSWVTGPSTSWTMSSVMRCGVPDRASSANNTHPSLKCLCHALTLARDMQCSPYSCDILQWMSVPPTPSAVRKRSTLLWSSLDDSISLFHCSQREWLHWMIDACFY